MHFNRFWIYHNLWHNWLRAPHVDKFIGNVPDSIDKLHVCTMHIYKWLNAHIATIVRFYIGMAQQDGAIIREENIVNRACDSIVPGWLNVCVLPFRLPHWVDLYECIERNTKTYILCAVSIRSTFLNGKNRIVWCFAMSFMCCSSFQFSYYLFEAFQKSMETAANYSL